MINKQRQAKGNKVGTAKLNKQQVLDIRRKYIPYKYSSFRLAKEYSVSQSNIMFIIHNKFWKDLS